MKYKIDVLVPVFNSSEELKKTLASISVSPAMNMLNVIVIDNNSDENIRSICDLYKIPIEFHRNRENIGRIPNWNRALEYVSNEWFMFLFAGDEIDASINFNEFTDLLDESSHIVFPFNLRGKKVDSYVNKWGFKEIKKNVETCIFDLLLSCKMPWGPLQCHLFRSSKSKIKFQENNPSHGDVEFIFSALMGSKKISFFPRPNFTWIWNEKRYHNQIDLASSATKDLQFTFEKLSLFPDSYSKFKIKMKMSIRVLMFLKHYSILNIFRAFFGIIFFRE